MNGKLPRMYEGHFITEGNRTRFCVEARCEKDARQRLRTGYPGQSFTIDGFYYRKGGDSSVRVA